MSRMSSKASMSSEMSFSESSWIGDLIMMKFFRKGVAFDVGGAPKRFHFHTVSQVLSLNTATVFTRSCACDFRLLAAAAISSTKAAFCCVT